MGFDIFSAIMAVLSILSFGAIGAADVAEEPVVTPVEVGGGNPAIPSDTKTGVPQNPAPTTTMVPESAEKPGTDLIAGTWKGEGRVPFMVSVTFKAVVQTDGAARFSGAVTSSVFGNHVFDTPAVWEYEGGYAFDTVISNVHTPVTCDGKKLQFPLNPYKLGLVNNTIADQTFIIDLYRG